MNPDMLLQTVDVDAVERMSGGEIVAENVVNVWLDPYSLQPHPWTAVRRWFRRIHDGDDSYSYFNGWTELIYCLQQNITLGVYVTSLEWILVNQKDMPAVCSEALVRVVSEILVNAPPTTSVEELRHTVCGLMRLFKRMDQNVDDNTPGVAVAYALYLTIDRLLAVEHEANHPRLI